MVLEETKPAIFFTPQECNNKDNRNCYLRRKPFWLLLGRMVNAGYDADAAREIVVQVYTLVADAKNVSFILQAMRKDKSAHPGRISLSVLPVR